MNDQVTIEQMLGEAKELLRFQESSLTALVRFGEISSRVANTKITILEAIINHLQSQLHGKEN